MCLVQVYPTIEGFTLPDNSFYSVPQEYKHLPVKKRKRCVTSWEWYKETHGNSITFFLQTSNTLTGVKVSGGVISMSIPKRGNNWPDHDRVSILDTRIKRIHYYTVIHDLNELWERYPKFIISDVDIGFLCRKGSWAMSIPIKLVLFKDKTHTNGTHLIQLQYFVDGKSKRKTISECLLNIEGQNKPAKSKGAQLLKY